jgi:two-component system LytT family response regulator
MPPFRVLIVDDEPLARERVRSFLKDTRGVEVCGECANGSEALEAIGRDAPDILFLDVQMPGCDGLQVLAGLSPDRRPATILATAHDRFAMVAFAVQVVDYLLKPFDRDRFQLALKRAIDHVRLRRAPDLESRLESALADARTTTADRLVVKVDGRHLFLKPDDIAWVEAEANYSVLHLVGAKRLMLRETLTSLEQRLGPRRFARVNRSALVHVDQLLELEPAKYGDYVVVLRNGVRLPLSRALRGRLAARIGGEA